MTSKFNKKDLIGIIAVFIIIVLFFFPIDYLFFSSLPKTYDECVNRKNSVSKTPANRYNDLFCDNSATSFFEEISCDIKGGDTYANCKLRYYNPNFRYPTNLFDCEKLKSEVDIFDPLDIEIKSKKDSNGDYNSCKITVRSDHVFNKNIAINVLNKCEAAGGNLYISKEPPFLDHLGYGTCRFVFK